MDPPSGVNMLGINIPPSNWGALTLTCMAVIRSMFRYLKTLKVWPTSRVPFLKKTKRKKNSKNSPWLNGGQPKSSNWIIFSVDTHSHGTSITHSIFFFYHLSVRINLSAPRIIVETNFIVHLQGFQLKPKQNFIWTDPKKIDRTWD